jgi:hypothetical protein
LDFAVLGTPLIPDLTRLRGTAAIRFRARILGGIEGGPGVLGYIRKRLGVGVGVGVVVGVQDARILRGGLTVVVLSDVFSADLGVVPAAGTEGEDQEKGHPDGG